MTKREEKLRERLAEMREIENSLIKEGYHAIAGCDEVGRGPLCGPVVAACVVLPSDWDIPGLDDSKKLSEKRRNEMYDVIVQNAVAYDVGIVDNNRIDEINILNATKEAMRDAIAGVRKKTDIDYLLIDALKLDVGVPCSGIVKGDAKSISIAAASIVAKVTRDAMMVQYAKEYPGYGWERNKGYGTKEHYEGIEKNGITPIHRRSFLKKEIARK